MGKIFFLSLLLYFLILIQTGFLPQIGVPGYVSNIVLIFVIILNFLEENQKKNGLAAAFIGGFLLDVFSGNFFGFWILISLASAFFIKYFFKKHLWLSIRSK